jgi:RNA polymerase sigma-70 factor, ECF subfamily
MADLQDTVTAAREGCRDAFDDLVRATYDDTYSHALRLVGNVDDAHDVAQDTYLKAFRHLRGFRGESSIGTWLYRITANCATNVMARRQRHDADLLTDDTPVADERLDHDPVGRAEAGDLRERLVAALSELPAKLRMVVVLRDVYDLSHESIALRLGISESAAKVRLHRARQKLRDQLYGGVAPIAARNATPTAAGTDVAETGEQAVARSQARIEMPGRHVELPVANHVA